MMMQIQKCNTDLYTGTFCHNVHPSEHLPAPNATPLHQQASQLPSDNFPHRTREVHAGWKNSCTDSDARDRLETADSTSMLQAGSPVPVVEGFAATGVHLPVRSRVFSSAPTPTDVVQADRRTAW